KATEVLSAAVSVTTEPWFPNKVRASIVEQKEKAIQGLERKKQRNLYLDRLQAFRSHRNAALFADTDFTGQDRAKNRKNAAAAAEKALKLFGATPDSTTPLELPDGIFLSDEPQEIREGCLELLLVWAEAETQAPSGRLEPGRPQLERALGLLDRAA